MATMASGDAFDPAAPIEDDRCRNWRMCEVDTSYPQWDGTLPDVRRGRKPPH